MAPGNFRGASVSWGAMGYRVVSASGVAAELRVPRHARGAIMVASLLAIAALLFFAGVNLHAVRIDCVFDAADAVTGRCTFTRLAALRVTRATGRFDGLAVLDRADPSAGGYELVGLEQGASFVFGPVANTGQVDAMRAELERLSHPETRGAAGPVRSGARVSRTFVNRRSAWLGWLCGVGAIAIVTAALGRIARVTRLHIDPSRDELRWHEEHGDAQSLPMHVIRGFDLDDEPDGMTLVAIVPGGRVPIARGHSTAVLAAYGALTECEAPQTAEPA